MRGKVTVAIQDRVLFYFSSLASCNHPWEERNWGWRWERDNEGRERKKVSLGQVKEQV